MLFSPALVIPPLILAASVVDLPRPDPEAVETRVQAALHARGEWREGDRLRFGMLKPVTCRDGLLRQSKRSAWAMEFTWSHAATGADERLHARVSPEGEPQVASGRLTEVGAACRWAN